MLDKGHDFELVEVVEEFVDFVLGVAVEDEFGAEGEDRGGED